MSAKVSTIVHSQSFLNQTSPLAATAIYTPSVTGLFRVSMYVEDAAASTNTPTAEVLWTDVSGSRVVSCPGIMGQGGPFAPVVVRATAGDPISIAANIGPDTFNVYVVVESLD